MAQARVDHAESRNRIWQVLIWPLSLAVLALGIAVLRRQGREIACWSRRSS